MFHSNVPPAKRTAQRSYTIILGSGSGFSTRIHRLALELFDREPAEEMRSSPLTIVIYTRIGCHLCEEAERLLRTRSASTQMIIQSIDVDTDPVLTARF